MKAETVTPSDGFVQRLSATSRGARLARLLAVQQLDAWGISYGSEPSDVAAVIVGELSANAVTHGRVPGRDFELRLALTARTLRIEVTDTRTEKRPDPKPAPPAADSECGRGLLLVEALATRWGVRERTVGKTIWAEVPSVPDLDPPCGGGDRCGHALVGTVVSKGYRTTWRIPEEHRADPAYMEAGAAIALGQAVYDRRTVLGFSQQELAQHAGLTEAEIERLEGGATTPTLALLRALALALDAKLDLSIEADETHVSFVAHAA